MSSINSKITSPILNKNLLIKNTSFLMETKRKYNGFPTQIHSVNSNITDNPYLNPGLKLSLLQLVTKLTPLYHRIFSVTV